MDAKTMFNIGEIDPGAALAAFLGPLTAVGITLWLQKRDGARQRRETLLRQLLATRLTPADPLYVVTIALIPIEYRKHRAVCSAHKDFLAAARKSNNEDQITIRLDELILEMMRVLGFDVERSRDIIREPYSSIGFGNATKMQAEALLALPRVANAVERTAAASEATRDLLMAASAVGGRQTDSEK